MARPRTISDDDILASAKMVFVSLGAQATMDAVAEKVGISAPALFKRFGSKKKLMMAALAPRPPRWVWTVLGGPTDAPIEAQLLDFVSDMDLFFGEMVPCMMVLKEAGIAEKSMMEFSKARACEAGFEASSSEQFPLLARRHLQEWFERANQKGLLQVPNSLAAAQMLLGAIQSRHFLRRVTGEAEPSPQESQSFITGVIAIFLRGVATPNERVPPQLSSTSTRKEIS